MVSDSAGKRPLSFERRKRKEYLCSSLIVTSGDIFKCGILHKVAVSMVVGW